ncbi:MAG: IclR family transcriptional regulator [Pseudolysinimonas sp.]
MSQSVERALSILDFIAAESRALNDVAAHLEVHKSTALRLLQTLEAGGMARHLPDGRYSLGFHVVALGQSALEKVELRSLARPYLQLLSDQFGHTVHLAQLVNNDVIYVDKIDGRHSMRSMSRVGGSAELHTSGVTKAIIANLDPATARQVLARVTYRKYTDTTLTTPSALLAELELARETGWAEDNAEYENYLGCVAAPIRNVSGDVVAAVSITALRALASREVLHSYVPTLLEATVDISRQLGWTGGHGE